jgi:hypothetical protein
MANVLPPTLTSQDVIRRLDLSPHPEGGYYRETFRHQPVDGGRGDLTVIYYLLAAGQRSAWHRVDATEVFFYQAGAPFKLRLAGDGLPPREVILGCDIAAGHHAHAVVPAHVWQVAESLGPWTLVACAVAPAFTFSGFDLAPAGWLPPGVDS